MDVDKLRDNTNHLVDSVYYGNIDDMRMLRKYNSLRTVHPNRKHDLGHMLRFLFSNGKRRFVGMHLKNISMLECERYDGKDTHRQENPHIVRLRDGRTLISGD